MFPSKANVVKKEKQNFLCEKYLSSGGSTLKKFLFEKI